ncbi:nucleolar MIF4G domain-containing protein 1 [Piliocolobus tephrosceles]|uniref:Nucleolar MIF4G domain-containing protein 1 n=1 Tax=Piliocolobus tephrosceles TaxID=591936 RepID=A0A8C9ISY1_9PRIM|nr:nucleolar MIF4G domain-containing protein 1 [Piliocolobus tephrosceles]XP_023081164.2 nucleolar MIF4G domain-containing protein 1 [Piliocolobus tephrosceles]XP_023081165.2 nucleolar MIF4G domain-containing protein 1 [Piliocolobus tephrosceles]
MAASRSTGEAGPGGSRGRVVPMKRKVGRGPHRGPGGGGEKALKRLKLAVKEFVHATSEGEAPKGCGGRGDPVRFRPGGRKSRKELRKEKRHLRKARRLRRTAGPDEGPGAGGRSGAEEASGPRRDTEERARPAPRRDPSPPKEPQPSRVKAKVTAPTAKTRPSAAATAAARKRALLAANEEEDREIRKLERCLGLNKRKKKDGSSSVPLSFARDGLDYILGVLESGKNSGLYDSSGEEEEDAAQTLPESDLESDSQDGSEEEEEDVEKEKKAQEAEAEAQSEDDDEDTEQEQGEEKEKGTQEKRREKRVRFAEDEEKSENSSEDGDITEQRNLCESGEKYIPPHVRRAEETVDLRKKEELERLKKHVKGLLNRLSEPNMASISGQLEELYMAHSRKDMNDTLTSALMSACATASATPSRLMMEHVLLVGVLHHTVGIEVGAHFLEAVVRKFDAVYKHGSEGKECDNLFTILAHLYNFHVVQSLLIFDILKKLIGTFTEKDIELILLMLKNVGFSLRKDDALSLKELITEAQTRASRAGSEFQDQTRIRFMLETMLALKNNDMRKIPGYDPEPVEKLRKLQRALVRSAGSGSETQLRISWDSILNAEQTGRWWIVGSAWSGAPMIDNSHHTHLQKQLAGTVSSKILELARKQRMNTDIRRNIFCTIMTSEDFLDAFEKLLKLGLKDQQEREIIHVLMDCCLQEKTYNPFYAFLASKFCEYERRFQMTFQFSIWDKFRDLENLPATNFSNLVHLVAHLLKTKSLSLSILKVVEFSELDKPRVHFLRKVLSILLTETETEDLSLIFTRVSDNPKLGMLREGLKLFISHFLLKNAQAHRSADQANVLRERADLVTKCLQGKASLRM